MSRARAASAVLACSVAVAIAIGAMLAAVAMMARSLPPAELPAVVQAQQEASALSAVTVQANRATAALRTLAVVTYAPPDAAHTVRLDAVLSPDPSPVVAVEAGDTLSGIAAAHHVAWRALWAANLRVIGHDPDLILPGEVLRLPKPGQVLPALPAYDPAPPPAVEAPTGQNIAAAWTGSAAGPSTVSTAGMSAYEACVIQHESGGNAQAVNASSGAGGLVQFLPSTWAGTPWGASYPGGAQTAPASVQLQAFAWLYAQAGRSPWITDGC